MNIRTLKGVGDKTAALFEKLEIGTVEELVSYYPRDYEQFSKPVSLADARPGELVAVEGRILGNVALRHVRGLSITAFTAACEGGTLQLTYFNMPYLKNSLKRGVPYIFRGMLQQRKSRAGEASQDGAGAFGGRAGGNGSGSTGAFDGRTGGREQGGAETSGSVTGGRGEMVSPQFFMEQAKIYQPEEYGKLVDCLQPRYALTKGLTNNALTKAMRQAIAAVDFGRDPLPEQIRLQEGFVCLSEAVAQMHFPTDKAALVEARRRLVFDEFFLFILTLRRMREERAREKNAHPMDKAAHAARLLSALPYRLTKAQQRVWGEIRADLTSDYVMNRLIQGDVGSGKTILAFLALLACAENGCQGAMMAPTETLARQHYESLLSLKKDYGLPISPVLLTGSVTGAERREIYARIKRGEADVILGTHALIQEKVAYKNLALVVTDEQHRFGVRQRESLTEKGSRVHVLVMSATPIPRTLAIILYGDLHISVLDELPADRLPIKNCVVNTSYRNTAYKFMEKEVAAGSQVYVICPMVEEGESQEMEDVATYTKKLKSALPASIRVESLHGRMRPAEKNAVMEAFARREIDVLVSTTVIEVGINVPNATVMMVENAERFGLAQLHQLRGRVGRGSKQSYCIFVSASENPEILSRLKILNESNDGFYIAGKDLALRGPGDLFGIRQSGDLRFALGDIYQDAAILQKASDWAERLFLENPLLAGEACAVLRERLEAEERNAVDFRSI